MENLPKSIIRLSDGEEFVLDEKTGKYIPELNVKYKVKGHLVWDFTYEQLMEYPQNRGFFKVKDGTEDLEAMKKNWLKLCESHNDGHGDEDDE